MTTGRIKASIGVTKNVGNYESVRIDVGIEFDGDIDSPDVWAYAWKTVNDQAEAKVNEVEASLGTK